MNQTRVIEIEPLTRVEGHGKVTIHLDEQQRVAEARLHIVEFRGFERFIRGRPYWEVPVIVQRLCGICPVSHHLAAAKAMDQVVGARQLTPTAEKMRRLMHYGQVLQSHVLHFFHLCAPDLLFGFDAPAERRHIFEVIRTQPELARKAIRLRQFGQEVIEATAGKKIHGTSAVPGGITRNLPIAERDRLLQALEICLPWCEEAVALARDFTLSNADQVARFANFRSNFLSLVDEAGQLDLYDGQLRAIDASGHVLLDGVDPRDFRMHLHEEVKSWSYMKFPFLTQLGPENGWYRVGPLARMNITRGLSTPRADAALREFRGAAQDGLHQASLAYHQARMIEVLHCAEMIERLLLDPDLQGHDLLTRGERQRQGIAVIEAPRGTLIHHYEVDDHDQVSYCNLIVSTTHNNTAMNRAVTAVARSTLEGQPQITDGLLNQIEVAVRAYDPCLSCATHALGQMPLQVELIDAEGHTVQTRTRDASDFCGGAAP